MLGQGWVLADGLGRLCVGLGRLGEGSAPDRRGIESLRSSWAWNSTVLGGEALVMCRLHPSQRLISAQLRGRHPPVGSAEVVQHHQAAMRGRCAPMGCLIRQVWCHTGLIRQVRCHTCLIRQVWCGACGIAARTMCDAATVRRTTPRQAKRSARGGASNQPTLGIPRASNTWDPAGCKSMMTVTQRLHCWERERLPLIAGRRGCHGWDSLLVSRDAILIAKCRLNCWSRTMSAIMGNLDGSGPMVVDGVLIALKTLRMYCANAVPAARWNEIDCGASDEMRLGWERGRREAKQAHCRRHHLPVKGMLAALEVACPLVRACTPANPCASACMHIGA